MEEEIEDIVGEVVYTDSQKTIGVTSGEFYTESVSDKNCSSGRETYVLDVDESSDSENFTDTRQEDKVEVGDSKRSSEPIAKQKSNEYASSRQNLALNRTNSIQTRSVETFTQTSKTIIELAKAECQNETQTLQTQTSFVCITERTVQYTSVQYSDNSMKRIEDESNKDSENQNEQFNLCLDQSLEDYSSKCPDESKCSDLESKTAFECSESSSNEEILRIIHGDSGNAIKKASTLVDTNYLTHKSSDSDSVFDEDSLVEYHHNPRHTSMNSSSAGSSASLSDVSKSIDKDVQELYNRLSESMDLPPSDRSVELDKKKFCTLTPLSEESLTKKTSTMEVTPSIEPPTKSDSDVLFLNDSGIKVKVFSQDKTATHEPFKLPPIHRNLSCPNSPHLSMLFSSSSQPQPLCKAETLPCMFEAQDVDVGRWTNNALASGESTRINGRNDSSGDKKAADTVQLPPIRPEPKQSKIRRIYSQKSSVEPRTESSLTEATPISIQAKIRELKMSEKSWRKPRNHSMSRLSVNSRSVSPSSTAVSERLGTIERGCDALCQDLLKRLRDSSWSYVAETLSEIPNVLVKFWGVISEQRIADFIRQICLHVDSPRTQVARSGCAALAAILKHTNYTKKPDFYEAVTLLLVKTGSFSRPVRRAANMALDEVVCNVDLNHAITALCVHGVEHKSALVRSAAARLLVVCAAIGGGGRDILRTRPPSAVTARRQTLRSMAILLDDKSNDARHYAERLYSMLRPLPNFEAYYLTDVTVEVASRQMKKYDQMLLEGEAREAR